MGWSPLRNVTLSAKLFFYFILLFLLMLALCKLAEGMWDTRAVTQRKLETLFERPRLGMRGDPPSSKAVRPMRNKESPKLNADLKNERD